MSTKAHRSTTHRRKRRAADEASVPAERAEAPARSLETLRQPRASSAERGRAALGLGRTVGNAQVARELGGDLQRHAEHIQRKGAKKKPPGTTTINAPRQVTYAVEAHTLDEAAQEIGARDEAGLTEWDPRLSVQTDENGVVTSATVTVTPTVTMPRWARAAKLSPRARAEWNRFRQALAQHEQGHVDLIHQHMGGLGEQLVGKTAEEAQAAFDQAVQALQDASDAYDERTDHGRNTGTVIDLDAH